MHARTHAHAHTHTRTHARTHARHEKPDLTRSFLTNFVRTERQIAPEQKYALAASEISSTWSDVSGIWSASNCSLNTVANACRQLCMRGDSTHLHSPMVTSPLMRAFRWEDPHASFQYCLNNLWEWASFTAQYFSSISTARSAGLVAATRGLYRNTMLHASTYSSVNDSKKLWIPLSLPKVPMQVSVHAWEKG